MGGHLKERPGRVAHEGGSRDVVDSRLLSRSLWTRLVSSCPDTFGHVGPPTLAFIVFVSVLFQNPQPQPSDRSCCWSPRASEPSGWGQRLLPVACTTVTRVLQSCAHHWPLQVPLWGRLGEPPMGRMSLKRVTEHP